jgi:2-phosphoglycerate kinase
MEQERCHKVVLIGGAPMSGKTTVARRLAAKLGYAGLSTDDLGEAVRAITTAQSHPDFHPMAGYDYREYYVCHSVEEIISHISKQHKALWPAIEVVNRGHASWGQPIIIEGWNLYPEWVKQLELPNIKSIWLIADEELLEHWIRKDERVYRGASNEEVLIQHYLGLSVWYNAQLKRTVERMAMPSIQLGLDIPHKEVCEQCLSLLGQG